MSNRSAKNIRRTFRKSFENAKGTAINDWCLFVNKQKLFRRIKLALLVIGGKLTYEKIDKV